MKINRRHFFGGLGGYSLAVLAGPASKAQVPAIGDARRRHFDTIAPPAGIHGIAEEPNMTSVDLKTDVLVAGGGLAGVCAAVSAARHGAKVVLIQDRSRLGGNSSSEVKMHVVGADGHTSRLGWREGGLIEEFRLDDAVNNPQRCFELWDLLLYDKVVSEPNITLLLETALFRATRKDGRITEVMARCDKSEHLYRIRADLFLDCTGDSRLALESGAELRSGRESRGEFGESLAPEKTDKETLGSSILFTARHHDKPMPFKPPSWARKVTADQLRMRRITSWEYGYWWIEWGGSLDTIRDNERIRFELLSIVMGVWDYIKNSGDHPSSKLWALDWVGMMPGKRGSRRVVGDHLLNQHDLLRGDFDDAVAIGGWPMDDHPPGGFDRSDLAPAQQIHTPEVYSIPLRSLYSRNVPNLMMAGRNISATHVAFTSTRVMATCAVIGQAAGTAAAKCLEYKCDPRELYTKESHRHALQVALMRDDQTIRGRVNEDPEDLAREAKVTASAERDDAKASNLLDGHVRDYPSKQKGGPKEIHHWAARMADDGAWIELAWDRPKRLSQVHITFDTGFERQLTLSAQNSVSRTVIRSAQPETVKDYQVACRTAKGEWKKVAAIQDNHQRLCRHRFEPLETEAVRIHVSSTNGDSYARIFEVRCYA